MNILLLSVGRRVELTILLKQSVNKTGGFLVSADASELSPALYFADYYKILPHVEDERYLQSLLDLISDFDVKLVIPTIDTELDILSKNKDYIEKTSNARILISSTEIIKLFSDKLSASLKFHELGFETPKILSEPINSFPVFVKPKHGSSSIGAQVVNNMEQLIGLRSSFPDLVIQEYIQGEEFTIDCLVDYGGNPIYIVPRRRIKTRAGEILQGQIIKRYDIINIVKDFLAKIRFVGPITIQIIEKYNRYYFIEVNPRLGGGVTMSINAGANILEAILDLHLGKNLTYREDYRDKVTYLRFDQSIELP